jgi:plastocyanin
MKSIATFLVLGSMAAACAGQLPPAASADSAATEPPPTAAEPGASVQPAQAQPAAAQPAALAQPAAAAPQAPAATAQAPAPAQGAAPSTPTAAPAATTAATGTIHGTITAMPAGAAKSAVVYLQDGPLAQAVNASITNKQMSFAPYISVVTTGGKVTFGNSDPFPHNIFTPDHEKWDLGQLDQHGAKAKTFAKAGAYTLLCNLHPNMKAYVLVIGSSYFAKSDGKGNFTIKDVPAGTYKLSAWAPGVQTATQSVTVSGDTAVNFELHR